MQHKFVRAKGGRPIAVDWTSLTRPGQDLVRPSPDHTRTLTLVSLHFHPEPIGTAVPVSDFAAWCVEQGWDVCTLTGLPHYPSRRVMPEARDCRVHDQDGRTMRWRGVRVRRLSHFVARSPGALGRFITEGSFAIRLAMHGLFRTALHQKVVSVCPSLLAVAVVSLFRPTHHTVIVHDLPSGLGAGVAGANTFLVALVRSIERWSLSRADRLIAVSHALKEQLTHAGVSTPCVVIPPHINEQAICVLPERSGLVTALYSGAVGLKQGFETLLDAAALIEQTQDNKVRFVVRGDGGTARELEKAITDRALACVSFEPLVATDQLSRGLADGHIHIILQRPEASSYAMPSKLFATLAAGRPFIATACQESDLGRLTRASGAGLLVPYNDPHALAQAVIRLSQDARLRVEMGARGRRYLEAELSRGALCAKTLEIVENRDPMEPRLRAGDAD
ncbi:MAG: glycosyltransferase family 4 protein [Pseudomonadota bacterium]